MVSRLYCAIVICSRGKSRDARKLSGISTNIFSSHSFLLLGGALCCMLPLVSSFAASSVDSAAQHQSGTHFKRGQLSQSKRQPQGRLYTQLHSQLQTAPHASLTASHNNNILQRGWHHIATDYVDFYRWHNLAKLGYGVLGSAVFANSRLDESINAYYQRHFVGPASDSVSRVLKHPGNNSALLWYLGAGGAGLVLSHWSPHNVVYAWSTRVLRSVLVGAPPVLLLQRVLGSKRPTHGSQWQPFVAEHAVSGHAFLGSLPFITAAQMTSHRSLKVLFYGLSTLTGWTRLNDNAHYFSQIIFGWWMGYLAVSSVSQSQSQSAIKHVQLSPYLGPGDSVGVQASLAF